MSDLHIGRIGDTRSARLDAVAESWCASSKRFKGFLGHHFRALDQASQFVAALREAEENVTIVCTGDLTAMGHPDEFDLAIDFLQDGTHRWRGDVGLGEPRWQERSIPGNHDQWPGRPQPLGSPTDRLANVFPSLPRTHEIRLGQRRVLMVGIDSDADVHPWTWKRLLAQGEFTTQLDAARNVLAAPERDEVRVLLCHHSRRFGPGRFNDPLVMRSASRSHLDQFLVDEGFHVMLCGHTHSAEVRRHIANHPNGQRRRILHSCCGTTTQRDSVPVHWKVWRDWTFEPNTLVVHRLYNAEKSVTWEAQTYLRMPEGFRRFGRVDPLRITW